MARIDMGGADVASVSLGQLSPENLFELGITYSSGREVAVDLVTAHKWFNIAAVKGNSDAAAYRQELASEMTPAQLSAALRAAREWLTKH